MKRRRKFSADFKSKVAIDALREQLPIYEIAKKYQVHPSQVTDWKKALIGGAGEVFESSKAKTDQKQLQKRKEDRLFRQIGQLQTEVDFLKESCEILGIDLPENELNQ